MALVATDVKVLHSITQAMTRPCILLLGYPDILCSQASLDTVQLPIKITDLPTRADSQAMWRQHERPVTGPMLETKALFRSWGAEVFVCDLIAWGGEDFLLDLNQPIPAELVGRFDVVVDPGTLEHCFNIAQAFQNIATLLRPGGVVFHHTPIAFPNHGFWSISPTTFYDFYESQGFKLGTSYAWRGMADGEGLVPYLRRIDPFKIGDDYPAPSLGSFVFRKWNEPVNARYPVQRCYSSNSRNVLMQDYIGEALGRDVMAKLLVAN